MDFSRFKTYTWLESKHPANGLKKVEMNDQPDLGSSTTQGIKERTTVAGYDYGYPYGPW